MHTMMILKSMGISHDDDIPSDDDCESDEELESESPRRPGRTSSPQRLRCPTRRSGNARTNTPSTFKNVRSSRKRTKPERYNDGDSGDSSDEFIPESISRKKGMIVYSNHFSIT